MGGLLDTLCQHLCPTRWMKNDRVSHLPTWEARTPTERAEIFTHLSLHLGTFQPYFPMHKLKRDCIVILSLFHGLKNIDFS